MLSLYRPPATTHFKIASDALEIGKHVLAEKPLAITVEECLEMTRLASAKEKILMVELA